MKSIKARETNQFEEWLFEMEDCLKPLVEYAEEKGYVLDYTLESMGRFEEFIATKSQI